MPELDLDHLRNISADALAPVPPRFAQSVADAVAAHFRDGIEPADSPLAEGVPRERLIYPAERIIRVIDKVSAGDADARQKCLDVVDEAAKARADSD